MFKVMIRDSMSPVAREILEATGQIEVVVDNDKTTNDPDRLAEIIGDFHGLALRSGTRVTEAVLARAPNLKVIGRAGIGVDNIDVAAATRNRPSVDRDPRPPGMSINGRGVSRLRDPGIQAQGQAEPLPRPQADLRQQPAGE